MVNESIKTYKVKNQGINVKTNRVCYSIYGKILIVEIACTTKYNRK